MCAFGGKNSWRLQVELVVLFSVVGVARIVSTYRVFSQTWDEPVHIASGMEWLQDGTYTYEDLHPPLARVAVAIGPYLEGIRLNRRDADPEVLPAAGNAILATHGEYLRNLSLARLGILPFFLLAVWTVWHWTLKLFGGWTAVASVGLFTTLPPVLGHAALATTDLPVAATFILAIFTFANWLDRPALPQTLVLGITVALAVLTKFTALLFLPACGGAVLLCWWFTRKVAIRQRTDDILIRLKPLGLAALVCVGLVFAGYRFSFHTVTGPEGRPHLFVDHLIGPEGKWHDLAYRLVEATPVPFPEFLHGITQARARVSQHTDMYLLGRVGTKGWWYFFPVALIVKTPIAFLLLTAVGAAGAIRRWREKKGDWQLLVPFVCAVALLLVCLPTKFNIGLRHILPIYPFLSVVGGVGIIKLWQETRSRWLGRGLAAGLAVWMLASTAMAHPDYIAYFNEFAGNHPERILVNSDLDWGQDLLRLSTALRARRIEHVAIAYNGSADLNQMNLPSFQVLAPCDRPTGWVAISMFYIKLSNPSNCCGGYKWITAYNPVALVGKSIRLYWIPKTSETSTALNPVKPTSRVTR